MSVDTSRSPSAATAYPRGSRPVNQTGRPVDSAYATTAASVWTMTRSSAMVGGPAPAALHRTAPVTPSNAVSRLVASLVPTDANTVVPSTATSVNGGHTGQ